MIGFRSIWVSLWQEIWKKIGIARGIAWDKRFCIINGSPRDRQRCADAPDVQVGKSLAVLYGGKKQNQVALSDTLWAKGVANFSRGVSRQGVKTPCNSKTLSLNLHGAARSWWSILSCLFVDSPWFQFLWYNSYHFVVIMV